MSIEPELMETIDDDCHEFAVFIRSLRPVDEKSGRFYHVVSALGDAAVLNYLRLRRAFDDDDQTSLA